MLLLWTKSNVDLFFFDFRGVVHYEFLLPGQNVSKAYFLSVMRQETFPEMRFKSIEEIKKSKNALVDKPKTDYLACFEDWKKVGISVFYREGITLNGMKFILYFPYFLSIVVLKYF